MKNRNWLNVSEYLFLIGAGVGSLASVASQQILYTAAPMSALLLLNLVNRRRLEDFAQDNTMTSVTQLDQKLSADLASVQQQVQALPNFLDLASLKKSIHGKNESALDEFAQEIAQLKEQVANPEWLPMRQEMQQLQGRYAELAESVSNVGGYLGRLTAASNRVEGLDEALSNLRTELSHLRVNIEKVADDQKLNNARVLQDQINHLNRRLNKLPTPFDGASLKQDVDALVKMMSDMASRRDLSRLSSQIEQLSNQNDALEQTVTPIKISTTILKKQLEMIASRLNLTDPESEAASLPTTPRPDPQLLENLRVTVNALEQRLGQLPVTADLAGLRTEMQTMVGTQLHQLHQELYTMQQVNQNLDHQQKALRDWVNRLPQILDSTALQSQVKYLAARVDWTETTMLDVQTQVDAAVKSHLDEMTHKFQVNHPTPEYELVFDVKEANRSATSTVCSRSLLEQALTKAQARLVVVYPFPSPETMDASLIGQFKAFLDRQGCLDVGWGHLGHASQQQVARSIDRRRQLDPAAKGFLYETLNQLTQLKRDYPDQFRFKVLGTDENFLVCDRSYAILGAESVNTASVVFPQTAVGLRTTNPGIIQGLLERFDDPVLEADDAAGYFSRATTRYDLGDKQGAIADYSEVLRINPNDDIAYNNRGLAHYDLGDRYAASADFEQAVQRNPDHFIAYCNRGVIRSELGDKLGAIEDYTYAIHINPDYTTAYFYRGLARTRMQNKLGAIEDYTEVLRLNPQDATAYFYRGLACIKIGHRLDAIQDLRQAAQLFSEQGDTANYQQTINTIKKLHNTLVIAGSNKTLVSNGVSS